LIAETPFTPYTTVKDYRPVAEPIPGPFCDRLGRLAQRHGVYVCSGTVEQDGDAIHNAAVLISPGGDLIHTHRKCTLGPGDAEGGYAPGNAVEVVETPFGRVGILICLDTLERENQQAMAARKPDIILVPAYGLAKTHYATTQAIDCMVDECLDEWRLRMQMLAKFCGAYVLRADHCGVEGPLVRVGHSLAVMPGGHVLAEATMRPGILRATLDPARAEQLRW
ncbi:MAG: carbon-nitrogen hydrolase family protein, partial [Candidatus Hydrogenedentes bacterium]|nr:carbon-nitrogen hydrolase family protein [Candidatus Hydrogenedentota bacterium]